MGLSNFIQEIKEAFKPEAYDSSAFNHPIAQKTKWNPKIPGGASVKNRNLHKISSTKLAYKSTTYIKVIGLVFVFLPIFLFFTIFDGLSSLRGFEFLFLIIPLMLPLYGVFFLYKILRPIVIDKKIGYLYKSYKKPKIGFTITPNKKWVPLNQVIALQILKEKIRFKDTSYNSYEINFVLKDASRYNIIDHSDLPSIEQNAITISNFIGVPIWNKMTGKTTFPEDAAYTDGKSHYDSTGQYDDSDKQYDSSSRYDNSSENNHYATSSKDNDDLDKPYDSSKKRKL